MGANVVNQQGEVIGEVQDVVTLGSRIVRTVESDVSGMNLKGFSWRTVEKLIAYGAAAVGGSDAFGQAQLGESRGWIVGAAGVLLAALHLSGPAATTNKG